MKKRIVEIVGAALVATVLTLPGAGCGNADPDATAETPAAPAVPAAPPTSDVEPTPAQVKASKAGSRIETFVQVRKLLYEISTSHGGTLEKKEIDVETPIVEVLPTEDGLQAFRTALTEEMGLPAELVSEKWESNETVRLWVFEIVDHAAAQP